MASPFCAVCALLFLDDGAPIELVMRGAPRDSQHLSSDPLCSHHKRTLHLAPRVEQVLDDQGRPLFYDSGAPFEEMTGLCNRPFIEQLDIIEMINGTPFDNTEGLINTLNRWLVQRRTRQQHIAEQPTVGLQMTREAIDEEIENVRMFAHLDGYLALKRAGLDTGEVAVVDIEDTDIPLQPTNTWLPTLADFDLDTNREGDDDRIDGE